MQVPPSKKRVEEEEEDNPTPLPWAAMLPLGPPEPPIEAETFIGGVSVPVPVWLWSCCAFKSAMVRASVFVQRESDMSAM